MCARVCMCVCVCVSVCVCVCVCVVHYPLNLYLFLKEGHMITFISMSSVLSAGQPFSGLRTDEEVLQPYIKLFFPLHSPILWKEGHRFYFHLTFNVIRARSPALRACKVCVLDKKILTAGDPPSTCPEDGRGGGVSTLGSLADYHRTRWGEGHFQPHPTLHNHIT